VREADSATFRILQKTYRRVSGLFDSDADVIIEPLRLGFSLCFRHDMDRIDAQGLGAFVEGDTGLPPSTLFFLEDQWRRFPDAIRKLADEAHYEVAVHSEAKPTPWCWSLHQLSRWIERSYGRRLKAQVRRFESRTGVTSSGHAAHAVNNYLPFQGWINWNIIENCSLRVGLDYVSDWRLPSRVAEGEPFPPPWPAYRRRRGDRSIVVLPTSWDDKFFFYSYEDHFMRAVATPDVPYRPDVLDAAFSSVLRQAELCRRFETPLVLNIHPWHSVSNGQPQFLELKRRLTDWARDAEVPILTCAGLCKQATGQ